MKNPLAVEFTKQSGLNDPKNIFHKIMPTFSLVNRNPCFVSIFGFLSSLMATEEEGEGILGTYKIVRTNKCEHQMEINYT